MLSLIHHLCFAAILATNNAVNGTLSTSPRNNTVNRSQGSGTTNNAINKTGVSGGGANPVVADFQLSTDSNGGSSDSMSITFGSSVSAGQLIVLAIYAGDKNGSNVITTPSGFTSLYGDSVKYGLFYKIASGSEGATFTVGIVDQAGVLIGLKITGANATPVDTSNLAASLTSPSITTVFNLDTVFSFLWSTSSGLTAPTAPSGMTLITYSNVTSAHGGPITLAVASLNQTTAGSTGTLAWTLTGGIAFQAATVGIKSV